MRRFFYSLPLFAMLLPWLFISFVVIAVGLANTYSLLLLLPVALFLGGAGLTHRHFTKREQHGFAALGAGTILAAPLFAILVGFATHGAEVLNTPENRVMTDAIAMDLGVGPVTKFHNANDDPGCTF